jgi:4a-hydroxytetrahydrobiopterin dehydratase
MSDQPLAEQPVEPEGDDPLTGQECAEFLEQLDDDVWEVVDDHHLEASYEFDDFQSALEFAQEAGDIAEEEWHHPDLHVSWGEVGVDLWTHDVGGLTRADFALAARFDRVYEDHAAE